MQSTVGLQGTVNRRVMRTVVPTAEPQALLPTRLLSIAARTRESHWASRDLVAGISTAAFGERGEGRSARGEVLELACSKVVDNKKRTEDQGERGPRPRDRDHPL